MIHVLHCIFCCEIRWQFLLFQIQYEVVRIGNLRKIDNKEAIFGFMQSCSCPSCRAWHHMHVIRTSSAHCQHVVCTLSARCLCVIYACTYAVCTRTRHPHIVCRPSAPLLMVNMGLNYLLLWQEFVIEWNLWHECWIVSFQDHVNDLRDNLCCWFSLHVKSGHSSHIICICTCHLHIIWAYVYCAHIICSGPWYLPS